MRTRRGFTLVEIACVISILAIVGGAFLDMYGGMYRELHNVARQADIKTDSQRAAAVVFGRLAADPSAQLDPDNHGIRLADGGRVYWDGHQLVRSTTEGLHPITRFPVADFNITRANGIWTINLVALDGQRPCRYVADWPRLQDTKGGQTP